jgi:hypothetical protein
MEHTSIYPGEIHTPYQWIVAGEVDRLAITPEADDQHKLCLQTGDNTEWRLVTVSPVVWAPAHSHAISDVTGLQDALNGKSSSGHTHDASAIVSGTIDIARLPASVVERMVVVADDTARFALTSDSVQNGDVVKVVSNGLMYYVKDQSQLGTEAGYEVFQAGAAASVPWSGVTDKPGVATTSEDGLMSATDKTKLNGIAEGANNYNHPANHPASIITQDENNRFVTDAEKAAWNGKMAHVAPGTSGNVLTSNGSAWVSSAPSGGGGTGTGAYTNYPSGRDVGTTYTNTGTTTRWVVVSVAASNAGHARISASIASDETATFGGYSGSAYQVEGTLTLAVPAGATYRLLSQAGSWVINKWKEYQ